jgi:hypothetical protein
MSPGICIVLEPVEDMIFVLLRKRSRGVTGDIELAGEERSECNGGGG